MIVSKHKVILMLHLFAIVCIIPQYFFTAQAEIIRTTELPLRSDGELIFDADLYQFEAPDDRIRIEVCYSLDLSQLQNIKQSSSEYTLTLVLKLIDKKGQAIQNIFDKKSFSTDIVQNNYSNSFVDLQKFYLSPDTLNFMLTLTDSLSGKSGSISEIIDFQKFPNDLSLSNPVFLAHIGKPSEEDDRFNRHNILMIPNPSRIYNESPEEKYFYIYFEINNLQYDPNKPSLYSLETSIKDLAGKTVTKIEHTQLSKVSANTSRIEKIKIDQLKTGMYNLHIRIADLENDHTASINRYFRVFAESQNVNLLLPMDETDIEKYLHQIKYIATDKEINLFQKLDKQGKQEFLLQFWKSKDPTPETPKNEFMLQHFQRIDYCEKHFRNGINGDRGRVYIQYGPPVDIQRSVSTLAYSRPVEIWTYSIEGRIEFVFVDRTNDDNYVLMHSTHPDEISNPGWMQAFQ